jgi:hypothetical protein
VVTQLAKERKGPALRHRILFYPVTAAHILKAALAPPLRAGFGSAINPFSWPPAMAWREPGH